MLDGDAQQDARGGGGDAAAALPLPHRADAHTEHPCKPRLRQVEQSPHGFGVGGVEFAPARGLEFAAANGTQFTHALEELVE